MKGGPLSEQLNNTRFISLHPLVDFAEVPVVCGAYLSRVIADYASNPEQPLFSQEAVSPSSPEIEAVSSTARGNLDSSQPSRPEMSTGFGRRNIIFSCMILIDFQQIPRPESVSSYRPFPLVTVATLQPLPMRRRSGVQPVNPLRRVQ